MGVVSDEELKGMFEALLRDGAETRRVLRQEIAAVRMELRDEIAAVRTELREEIAAVRMELGAEIAAVRTELRGEITALGSELRGEIAAVRTELRAEIAKLGAEITDLRSEIVTLRRHMDVGFEEVGRRFDLINEVVRNVDEKLDRTGAELHRNITTTALDTQDLIRYSYALHDRRIFALESRVH
jgi:cell division protein FtsB